MGYSKSWGMWRRMFAGATLVQAGLTFAGIAAPVSAANNAPDASSTAISDTQAQRRNAQQEALERERQQKAPIVDLQPSAAAIPNDDGLVPLESPCFKTDTLVLVLPPGLSEPVKAVGQRALAPDFLSLHASLLFASHYLERYRGQCIGREGVNLIVHRLSALILQNGYSTTRLLIPEQDLSGGTLKLDLIPGVIGEIRFADAATYGTWRNAFPTHAGDLLNLRKLEQGLEQMKRVPNQDVDMQIVPGSATGVSDVMIAVKRTKPWTLSVSLDDSGLKSTGQLQSSINFAWNNPLGLSDIFNLSYSHDANGHANLYGTFGNSEYYSLPWGNWTFTETASQYHYHQEIAGAVQSFVSSGDSKTLDFKTEYAFYRNQLQKNTLAFRTGKYFSHAFIDGSPIDIQRRDNSYAEVSLAHKHYFGEAQLDTTLAYRWGVPWFGAQSDLSGAANGGPTYYYHIETLDATLKAPFHIGSLPLHYLATIHAQDSSSVLYPTEYLSIGSRYTVRGFDGNTLLAAEKGVFLRNELEVPLGQTGQALYLGVDGGEVFGPNAQNLPGRKLAGAVLGLRGNPFQNAYYDVFIGGPLYQPNNFPNRWPVAGFSLSYQI
ncbi:MAG TPA: ShlB/FhaC/HecB family hemolysin secretion/activation protein [Herbaspirillum sp.]|nr:ShlB/FhaC/HecB family hemolysin secretion/activation protein [Herbaspirillum sp.]